MFRDHRRRAQSHDRPGPHRRYGRTKSRSRSLKPFHAAISKIPSGWPPPDRCRRNRPRPKRVPPRRTAESTTTASPLAAPGRHHRSLPGQPHQGLVVDAGSLNGSQLPHWPRASIAGTWQGPAVVKRSLRSPGCSGPEGSMGRQLNPVGHNYRRGHRHRKRGLVGGRGRAPHGPGSELSGSRRVLCIPPPRWPSLPRTDLATHHRRRRDHRLGGRGSGMQFGRQVVPGRTAAISGPAPGPVYMRVEFISGGSAPKSKVISFDPFLWEFRRYQRASSWASRWA